jgi:protein-S-isoprenylcysteine O-methyltransferase Ste14
MTIDEFSVRRAVVFASAVIYWAGVYVQIARVRRKAGRLPNIKPRGLKERLLWLGWFSVIVLWIAQPVMLQAASLPQSVRVIGSFYRPATFIAGIAVILVGHLGTYWCYAAMGASWRIGVKKGEKTALVTSGPYDYVRHPIYAFQALILVGAFFLLPTALSIAILVIQLVIAHVKALDEEMYLLSTHGESYAAYLARTGRFLPRLFGRKWAR